MAGGGRAELARNLGYWDSRKKVVRREGLSVSGSREHKVKSTDWESEEEKEKRRGEVVLEGKEGQGASPRKRPEVKICVRVWE